MSNSEEDAELSRVNLTFSADDHLEFDLPPIHAFGRAVSANEIQLDTIKAAFVQLPGCTSPRDLRTRAERDRVEEAIVEGQHYLQRIPDNNDEVLTRKQENDYFPKECTLLDRVLANVRTHVLGPNSYAYAVEPEPLLSLSELLVHRRRTASDSLLLQNRPLPEIPRWGPYGDPSTFWAINEFEILGACYRREVECFLAYLATYHKFLPMGTKKSRREGSKRKESEGKESNSPESPRTSTPQRTPEEPDTAVYRSPGRKGWSQEIEAGAGYNVDRDRAQRRAHRIRIFSDTFFTANTTSSATMRELFSSGADNTVTNVPRDRPPHIPEEDENEPESEEDHESATLLPNSKRLHEGSRPSPDGGDDDDDDGDGDGPRNPSGPTARVNPPNRPSLSSKSTKRAVDNELRFDTKLKRDLIPEWNGDTDALAHWILRVNEISKGSPTVFRQLGQLVPQRLKGAALKWYYSNPSDYRAQLETNWETMRSGIGSYYMNRSWMDKQKSRALRATYRDSTAPRETPSEYFIRKLELIRMVYELKDSELIHEIMSGAPSYWNNILTTHLYDDIVEFQTAIKYHEDNLMRMDYTRTYRQANDFPNRYGGSKDSFKEYKPARTNAVGWSKALAPPKWPKDDKNVSVRGSPVASGGRPCRHCGSDNHWDNECKYAHKATREARANSASGAVNPDVERAQQEYDDLYYSMTSDEDNDSEDHVPLVTEDFCETLQTTASVAHSASYDSREAATRPDLGGMQENCSSAKRVNARAYRTETEYLGLRKTESDFSKPYAADHRVNEGLSRSPSHIFNRRTRRQFAKDILVTSRQVSGKDKGNTLLELTKIMARPAGCSFLGAKATEGDGFLQERGENCTKIIFDTGSDITLISEKAWKNVKPTPKLRSGLRVNLVQVTGSATISGYIEIPIFFETTEGPVKIVVEAYVVKGMTSEFILGNDFQDQYSLSVLREEGESSILLGNTGRHIPVQNSVTRPYTDENGHGFKIRVRSEVQGRFARQRLHKSNKSKRRQNRIHTSDKMVRSTYQVVIPAETSKWIPVTANVPAKAEAIFAEKVMTTNREIEDVYGPADSIISKRNPGLHVANFSKLPVTISSGQELARAQQLETWLDKIERYSNEERGRINTYANLLHRLANPPESHKEIKLELSNTGDGKDVSARIIKSETNLSFNPKLGLGIPDDVLAEPPLDGGPKTAETPEEFVDSSTVLDELDISSDLSESRREKMRQVLLKNKEVFGTNGRLGNIDARVTIPLQPGATPVSLPPYPMSPANREAMDKQMDAWIQLRVIEPSKSPWGAPAFVVWRNGKPRMVIDWRRLNDQAIPDEFPIPRQDDILHALSGSQWLTTLDALAGFTQMTFVKEDREKTAFRTHRGLYQFIRMPFGYRNGPAVFQRVMQGILAPFLWLFALVYIDDIVIFSLNFEDHISHIDQVLGAIAAAKVTLSPAKCHFGYQSLILLGQKVSRLGMSTHREKVKAILDLAEPRNVKELQVFLGMMVYFSNYVPFYAWMAYPLFQLLKKENHWTWNSEHQHAFQLCKTVLTNAPVRAYAIPGLPYRVYSDACDYGLAAILQQVQPIRVGDLQGTKAYERLEKAFKKGEPIPNLVMVLTKENSDVPEPGRWAEKLDDTIVHVERVIAYWSRVLQSAERNYSPTEREALALKEGLIKFQPFLEGEKILAITDHAALTWSKTFQNVNRRLLSWGLVFSAYPNLRIIHRAGRIHSNVDPISRLRRRVPEQDGPPLDNTPSVPLEEEDPMRNMFDELGEEFEAQLLETASRYVAAEEFETAREETHKELISAPLPYGSTTLSYQVASRYATVVGIDKEEVQRWRDAYAKDEHFAKVLNAFKTEEDFVNPAYRQYLYSDDGLIYFEDSYGNTRLCVPASMQVEIMGEVHNNITEAAHAGYAKTYNRIAGTYYWPRMSRHIKQYVETCDICQKSKPRRHAPVGLLQPIPIPSRPFEVVTMDFIPELPESNGNDNILVIVDKLTKYAIFIPTVTTLTETATAKLFFHHIIAHFGIPRQIISDRDTRWRGDFWKEICRLMGMTRALTTAYHPQADGQTEVLNQTLEIQLRAYIGPSRNDWDEHLDALMLAYNTTPHTATGFAPAFLLRGYYPTTSSTLMHEGSPIPRPTSGNANIETGGDDIPSLARAEASMHTQADDMIDGFLADRNRAQEALLLGQIFQRSAYNKGRLTTEFEEGEKVLLNPHSLNLLRSEKGRGNKLLMKYDGPFEIMQKLSPVSYRLRMPSSYGIHPVLNIAHLERYKESPAEFGSRPHKNLNRDDFDDRPEYDVDEIVGESWRKGRNGRRIPIYRTRFTGYGPESDEWLTPTQLTNSPLVLEEWRRKKVEKIHPKNRRIARPAGNQGR